jgi:aerobic carbon-monoxide dehydrogenase medium subunit
MNWHAPHDLDEALLLRQIFGEEITVHAGGTFLGILMNQGLIAPGALLSLGRIAALSTVEVVDGELRLGAMVTHRQVEQHPQIRSEWPMLARAFGVVASHRVRAVATVGGVLADADYASDPPAALAAAEARAVLRGPRGVRTVSIEQLILGYYTTCIEPDELLVEVRVPAMSGAAVYRKFTSRSSEDRPCVTVAAVAGSDGLAVVVGACAERPQRFDELCAVKMAELRDPNCRIEIAEGYAAQLAPISDIRGSAGYRRRICAVEVRRALEDLVA